MRVQGSNPFRRKQRTLNGAIPDDDGEVSLFVKAPFFTGRDETVVGLFDVILRGGR